MDLNAPILELSTFDDGDPLLGLSATPTNEMLGLDVLEEERGEHSGNVSGGDIEDFGYAI